MNRWDSFTTEELQSIYDAYWNADREWTMMLSGEPPIMGQVRGGT